MDKAHKADLTKLSTKELEIGIDRGLFSDQQRRDAERILHERRAAPVRYIQSWILAVGIMTLGVAILTLIATLVL